MTPAPQYPVSFHRHPRDRRQPGKAAPILNHRFNNGELNTGAASWVYRVLDRIRLRGSP